MISHDKKIILILPPKTGGTSVLHELLPYSLMYKKFNQECGGFDYFESQSDEQLKIKAKHKRLVDYKNNIDTYKLYGIARNPYSRMVSWWRFRDRDRPFKMWLNTFPCNSFQQLTYEDYFSFSGIHVNNIIHTNELQSGFDSLCDSINVPRKQLPLINKTSHKYYTEYYDDEAREIVAKKCARDIEMFNYKFGE